MVSSTSVDHLLQWPEDSMTRRSLALAALLLVALPFRAVAESKQLSKEERAVFLRSAQIWKPTNVAEMDIRTGPASSDEFRPDELVTCDYVPTKPEGSSRKFNCKLVNGDVVKVRYGADNGEVVGSVLATRLLWALGFGADRAYPVRVICNGCSKDPFNNREVVEGSNVFDNATIELKMAGKEMKARPEGWEWRELDQLDETAGGAPRAQRDGLKLLAVFLQHSDNKGVQQRLVCLSGGLKDDGPCTKPFLMIHDVGLTFGHANYLNRNVTASVNFDLWSKTPIWRNQAACIGHLAKSSTGTLGDPKIGEDGRAFLSGLLMQLTDQQIRDLFETAHVERRSPSGITVDDWVAAFNQKRAEIASTHCP